MNIKKPLSGVSCAVTNCMYHTTDNKCVANGIHVDPKKSNTNNADCTTYKPCNTCE